MADYIYLLQNRLSAAQRSALDTLREIARTRNLTLFLVGGAVRDLTSGSPVGDLDVVIQGNATKLRKDLERAGAVITGDADPLPALFLRFPGSVRVEFGSMVSITYPKPARPVIKLAGIQEDLRRRDFTANAMALSLNEGSYGLLIDPLNGVADIENQQLRLVSNYGFIEDPVRMIRAARLMARLGWSLHEKTQTRYETGQQENYIAALGDAQRGYEAEEIVHEEDPLRVMRRLEADGWMKHIAPYWGSAKANAAELEKLRDMQTQLEQQGIHAHAAAASFPLLTAKLSPKEVAQLKASFIRPGFVAEIESLEGETKDFAAQLGSKAAALPSQAWKAIHAANPQAVLAAAYATRSPALQAKFRSFLSDWPQARQRIPYALMQEMRIVPDLPVYDELLEKLYFELMDGKLTTPEEMKAFLEPYSPPAPPPPVSLRRMRTVKKEAKGKSRAKKAVAAPDTLDTPAALDASEAVETPSASAAPEAPDSAATALATPPPAKSAIPKTAPAKAAAPAPAAKAAITGDAAAKPAKPKTAPAKSAGPVKAAAAPATDAAGKTALKKSTTKSPAPPMKKAAVKSAPAKTPAVPVKKSAPPAKAAPGKTAPVGKAVKPAPAKPSVKKAVPAKAATKQAPQKKTAPAKQAAAKKTAPQKAAAAGKLVPAKKARR